MAKIIEKFHSFESRAVYVDRGYGGYQCELLEKYFHDIGKSEVFKAIDFGSALKQLNAYTGETVSKRLKGVLVYSLQQQFEKSRIELSPLEEGNIENIDARYEDKIVYQLQFYAVDHYDGKDNPVFSNKGDHMLDALMLSNFAFIEKIEKSINFMPDKAYFAKLSTPTIIVKESNKVQRTNFLNDMQDTILTIPEIKNLDFNDDINNELFKKEIFKKKGKLFGNKKIKRTSFL